MKNTWFISDTHFAHANIIHFSNRPFAGIEAHDETLIENWNRAVAPSDEVYFLGDFVFKSKDGAVGIRRQLNGSQIFFIEGNHDSAARQIRGTFAWYDDVKMVEVNGQKIWLSHYAHRVWPHSHHGAWHLYGHSHHSLPDDPNSLSFDVGVDATAVRLGRPEFYGTGTIPMEGLRPEDYRPIHFDEVLELMNKKTFRPVDHHGA